jgi:hypothetical protein
LIPRLKHMLWAYVVKHFLGLALEMLSSKIGRHLVWLIIMLGTDNTIKSGLN